MFELALINMLAGAFNAQGRNRQSHCGAGGRSEPGGPHCGGESE
jgi:hypothetical protein